MWILIFHLSVLEPSFLFDLEAYKLWATLSKSKILWRSKVKLQIMWKSHFLYEQYNQINLGKIFQLSIMSKSVILIV